MSTTPELKLEFEWLDPEAVRCEELRATWASLRIFVGDSCITEVEDRRARSVRTQIYVPLFPLAEWIASHWWFLHVEAARPTSTGDIGFERRHNIQSAREGFVLPSLSLVTQGESIDVQWCPTDFPDANVRFLSSGRRTLQLSSVTDALSSFVDSVIERLNGENISKTTLHDEWSALQALDVDEAAFCRGSARMGLDPFNVDTNTERRIIAAASALRPELVNDFFSLSNANTLDHNLKALQAVAHDIESKNTDSDSLAAVRHKSPALERRPHPWESGYQYATELRVRINGSRWKSRAVEELASYVGLDSLDDCMIFGDKNCRFVDAVAGRNQQGVPIFHLEKRRPESRQFAFCRALFESLTVPHDRFAVVSGLRTERQQMNRAFAAEFLVPHRMLKQDLSGAYVDDEEVQQLAEDYGVSTFVIQRQIQNHKLATFEMEP